MEIKHTIEILTKDIQDIENLVRNLNNYPTPPRIDIDLAMAKLRNVYELLAMISSDIKSDMQESTLQRETVAEQSTHQEESPLTGNRPEEASEKSPLPENKPEEAIEQAPLPEERKEVAKEAKEAKEFAEVKVEKEVKEEPIPEKFKEEVKKASIIAEKFAANKSINERIAPGNNKDVSSKLTGEPIDSIKRNIGINDRFLIIRELLNGDNEGYNQLVQQLDACANFDEAHGLIEQSFPNKMEHEGVDILVKLSRRRFLS
jgi:hypothetical protein